MNLVRAIRSSAAPTKNEDELRYSLTDYLNWTTYNVGGNSYTLPFQQTYGNQPAEAIEGNFVGYVQGAYKYNGVVFACMLARQSVFSEARFLWRVRAQNARPARSWTDSSLEILDHPWPGGVTGDLLARMIQTVDIAGNFYGVVIDNQFVSLRPDCVQIILEKRQFRGGQVGYKKIGYAYHESFAGGAQVKDPVVFTPEEVVHFAPIPDPMATYRGMSWLTPVIREIQADQSATSHKQKFFDNGATPNLVVRLDPAVTPDLFEAFKEKMEEGSIGIDNAYKTLYLGGAADVSVIGANMRQLDFKNVQGAGETRIAAAAGVPPVIVGLSEGLQAATYSNYAQARRRYADGTIRPLWRNASASLQTVVKAPQTGAELWYDDKEIAFLREDAADRANITSTQAQAIRTLTDGGFDPDSAVAAVLSGELDSLKGSHTGMFSVQLQAAGTDGSAVAGTSSDTALAGTSNTTPKRALRVLRDNAGRLDSIEVG